MIHRPIFVLVPGAWHRADTWSQTTAGLESEGYTCVSVTLPSTSGDPAAGFGDDVKTVQEAIRKQTTQRRDVVVVVHSYGGHVGSSAIKGLAEKHHDGSPPPDASSSGHVIGLAMMATGFSITGMSFLEMTGGSPPPFWIADTETGFATLVADVRDLFYHDLPEKEGTLWARRLTKHSLKSLAEGGEYAYAGWKDVPCWFLVTLEDHALPAQAQKLFVKTAQDDGADVTMREVKSSHSPMLSHPGGAVDFILQAAAHFVDKKKNA